MKTIDDIKFKPNLRHQAGMTVPEGFFENFQKNLELEIDRQQAPEPVIGQRKTLLQRWSVAASIVVLAVLGISLYNYLESPVATETEVALANNLEEETDTFDQEEMLIGAMSDYELYDLYCDLY